MNIELLAQLLPSLLVKSTVLLVAAFAITYLIKRLSSAEKHLIWSIAFCSLLLLPALLVVAPKYQFSFPAFEFLGPFRINMDGLSNVAAGDIDVASSSDNTSWGLYLAKIRAIDPIFAAGLVYLSVMFALLLRIAVVYFRVGGSVSKLENITSTELQLDVDDLKARMGIKRPIELLVSDHDNTPWTWGVLKPKVVVPGDFAHWSAENRHNALIHELSHISRFDVISFLLARLCCGVYWFHPLVWWAYLKMTVEAEKACDDRVIMSGSRASSYARQLTQVANAVLYDRKSHNGNSHNKNSHRNNQHVLIAAMARRSSLSHRVKGILMSNVRRNSITIKSFIAALCLISAVTIPLVGAQSDQQNNSEVNNTPDKPPMSEYVYRKLSEVHELLGAEKYDDALDKLDQVATEDNLNSYEKASIENYYGYVYWLKDDVNASIQHYDNILNLKDIPQNLIDSTTKTIAQLYLKQDQPAKGIEYYKQWLETAEKPDRRDYFWVAQAHYKIEQYQQAKEYSEKSYKLHAMENEPPEKKLLQFLVAVYNELGDGQNATRVRKELLDLYPDTDKIISN